MSEQIDLAIRTLKLDRLDSNPHLQFLKQRTSLLPSQLALALLVFLAIVMVVAQASNIVIMLACYLLPAYFTLLALEDRDMASKTAYLTYWVVFILTEVVAPVLGFLLGGTIWTFLRVALAVALLHPELGLAKKLYETVIRPYVMGNNSFQKKAQEMYEAGAGRLGQFADKQGDVFDTFKKIR